MRYLDSALVPRRSASATRLSVKAFGIAALAFALGGAGSSAYAQSRQTNNDRVTLAAGTIIPVTLNTALSSNGSSDGDTFSTSIDDSKQAYASILRGATIVGRVHRATAQSGSDPGTLDLAFTSLRLADGRSYAIDGGLTSMDPKQVDVRSNGILSAKNTSKNNRLTYAGIGAGAGALVGLLGGGKLKIEDILLGGAAGYGVGSIIKSPQTVHDVKLAAGTPMGVLLDESLTFSQGSDRTMFHESRIHNGIKYYRHNGQPWTMNMATGERHPVSNRNDDSTRDGVKYYSYQGHPYSLNTETGERSRLD